MLDVSDDVIIGRISKRRTCAKCKSPANKGGKCEKCGGDLIQRADDTPEAIKHRLTVYKDQTEPLLEYYKPRNITHVIDGNRPVEEIFKDIIKILGE